MLHNICIEPLRYGSYSSTHNDLEHFRSICRKYTWGTLSDFLNNSGNLLTFDDGYKSIITHGLPILEEHQIPAVIFVTTGFISGEVYPYELALSSLVNSHDTLRTASGNLIELSSAELKENACRNLREEVRSKGFDRQIEYVNRLAELNDHEIRFSAVDRFLSWSEIIRLDKHPLITLGAHTHTHLDLTVVNPIIAYREIQRGKIILENKLSRKIDIFAYPYGSHNILIRSLARFAGFKYAFTAELPSLNRGNYNYLRIPRLDAGDIENTQND